MRRRTAAQRQLCASEAPSESLEVAPHPWLPQALSQPQPHTTPPGDGGWNLLLSIPLELSQTSQTSLSQAHADPEVVLEQGRFPASARDTHKAK